MVGRGGQLFQNMREYNPERLKQDSKRFNSQGRRNTLPIWVYNLSMTGTKIQNVHTNRVFRIFFLKTFIIGYLPSTEDFTWQPIWIVQQWLLPSSWRCSYKVTRVGVWELGLLWAFIIKIIKTTRYSVMRFATSSFCHTYNRKDFFIYIFHLSFSYCVHQKKLVLFYTISARAQNYFQNNLGLLSRFLKLHL